ncbi:MAG: hypothetical protein OXF97_02955, partial [Nitrospira sp.]|nr:hypothetical protein [Nitrospira sp.]
MKTVQPGLTSPYQVRVRLRATPCTGVVRAASRCVAVRSRLTAVVLVGSRRQPSARSRLAGAQPY